MNWNILILSKNLPRNEKESFDEDEVKKQKIGCFYFIFIVPPSYSFIMGTYLLLMYMIIILYFKLSKAKYNQYRFNRQINGPEPKASIPSGTLN